MSVTLGIDLAAEPKATAACEIEWRAEHATVRWVAAGLDDDELLRRARAVDVVGIDAPFGWPTAFVEAITAHHAGRRWPFEQWEKANRRRLRLRVTDETIYRITGITPLSVSSDAIAIPATRCASLIGRLGVKDRSGDGHVYEVYPAAALLQWGLQCRGYKDRKNRSALARLLSALRNMAPWLGVSPADETACGASDHVFDALVASLIARAAGRGLTLRPTPNEAETARVEGWIALPRPGSLEELRGT